MRIAYIVSRFPEWSETFILDQITGMLDLGQEVRIYARSRPKGQAIHPQIESYCLLNRTRYLPGKARSRLGLMQQACQACAPVSASLIGALRVQRNRPMVRSIILPKPMVSYGRACHDSISSAVNSAVSRGKPD